MKRELDAAYDALNVLPPTYEPAATGHVPEMLELIGELIERGHAYAAADGSGDVYFDVRSWPAYGELTHQGIDDMEAAEDADPRGKRDPRDFALWKGWKKESEPRDRLLARAVGPRAVPAGTSSARRWPASTSAPRSTSTAAASTCASRTTRTSRPSRARPGTPFASYWMHNAWITTAGEKMSKSLGNSLLVPEVLKRVRGDRAALLHGRRALPLARRVLASRRSTRRPPAFRRIEGFLDRRAGWPRRRSTG